MANFDALVIQRMVCRALYKYAVPRLSTLSHLVEPLLFSLLKFMMPIVSDLSVRSISFLNFSPRCEMKS